MLSTDKVRLVQQSFAKVEPIADTASKLFYQRLFEVNPSLRTMFPDDLSAQRVKLMKTLKLTVAGLSITEKILPALQSLGRRHIAYLVEDEHYDDVGAALVWTLQQGLGEAFTDEVRDAWVATYNLMADIMIKAANEASGKTHAIDEQAVPAWETPEFVAWLNAAAYGTDLDTDLDTPDTPDAAES